MSLRVASCMRLAAAAVCGLCLAGAALAPALAAGSGRAVHAARTPKRARCVRAKRHHVHRARRCRAKRHHLTVQPPPPAAIAAPLVPAVSGALPGEASSPTASPPSTASSTAPASAAEPEPPEVTPTQPPPTQPPSVAHVQVNAVEYSFSLSRTTVPAGKVDLEFVNNGQDEHNLSVDPPEEGAPYAAVANTPSKGVGDLELEMRAGSYTFFCSLPGHEAKGMKATLTVE